MSLPRPPYDQELYETLTALFPEPFEPFTLETIVDERSRAGTPDPMRVIGTRNLRHVAATAHRAGDLDPMDLALIQPSAREPDGSVILFFHGGGMFRGDRFDIPDDLLDLAEFEGVTLISAEYRLAPEHPDPAPVEDCFLALRWLGDSAVDWGLEADRILVAGASAGGGLAAGAVLLARERGGPTIAGQLLMYPMLDDRDRTVSTRQFDGHGLWGRLDNRVGWEALLGARRGGSDVSAAAAPARATELSGLPPTFIDVGSAEVFRDECVGYASALWESGVAAELHVWAGGFHGFDAFAPRVAISKAARAARGSWIRRILELRDPSPAAGA